MRIAIGYGAGQLEVDVPAQRMVAVRRQPQAPALTDPVAAVRTALEQPYQFPPLRRALTPDDHVVIIVDEQVPQLARLLTPLLEHITKALVPPELMTLLCAPTGAAQTWIDELPDAFQDVRVAMHDPGDRRHLSYLATTKRGRRLYLNRTVVDADQLVVLTRRGYDPYLGYAGAEGSIYPALSDEATLRESLERMSLASPAESAAWPFHQEAIEVAWLLGAPFLVQVIDGSAGALTHVIGGSLDSSAEGQRLLDARWRIDIDQPVDTVVAAVGGDPAQHTFADLAQALACAARVVNRHGHIILLTGGAPTLGAGAEMVRSSSDAGEALALVCQQAPPDSASAFQWASAAEHATIYLLSQLPSDVAEELFTVPLEHPSQVQRLLREGKCLFVEDAHKTLAVAAAPTER